MDQRELRSIRSYPASCFFILLVLTALAHGNVSLPHVFSDHMVLQRQIPVRVWGMAAAGESVSVTFRGETRNTSADSLGRWQLNLSPAAAGGPYELTVQGTNTIVFHDVLVGDVWVASGQSNMEFPMTGLEKSKDEIAAARFPKIRLLRVKHAYSFYPLDDVDAGPWTDCNPDSVGSFSAVAYYFARELQERENVPIGLIESSWGGTLAEAWTSLHMLSSDAGLMPVFHAWANMTDHQAETALMLVKEKKETDDARQAGKEPPHFQWHPDPHMWAPTELYNAMIAPLTPFAIRGVIWYQGESNSRLERAPLYQRLFPALIQDWRNHWGEGDSPFLFVQISNFKSGPGEDWAIIRDAQRKTLALRNTAMAVTIDIGNPDDVHPKNKRDVGHRLALAARAVAFGESVEYSGPLFRQVSSEPHALRVWFDHADKLVARGGELKSFEVAGDDGNFVSAQARIDGTTVVVSSPTVPAPVLVRYGWANSPECNLFNGQDLPASPFTSAK